MANMKSNTAVLIMTGNEIVSGKTVDTNSNYIANELIRIGIRTVRIIAVPDDISAIHSALDEALKHSSIIITSGGLGPTSDDITREAVSEYFGLKLILDEEQLKILEKKFKNAGYSKMPENNISQAKKPEGAVVFSNPRGSAPTLLVESKGSRVFLLPGVPMELRGIISDSVIPYLEENIESREIVVSRTIRVVGVGESKLADTIRPALEDAGSVEVAYIPKDSLVDIRLTAYGDNKDDLIKKNRQLEEGILKIIPDKIYGFDTDTLESVVGDLLLKNQLTVSTAESCTGGLLGDRITSVSGSSGYFIQGYVTYSNEAKTELLGVDPDIILKTGAVSEETAAQMAEGVRNKSGCDIGVSITGIAGPAGGTPEKPVGLVYIGLADKHGTIVKMLMQRYGLERQRIKLRSAYFALNMIRLRLMDTGLY
ncbi:MAG: competence/damage-inducible protein A [bacterium]|nr:competence/damage-inducible protein A [bacterium]